MQTPNPLSYELAPHWTEDEVLGGATFYVAVIFGFVWTLAVLDELEELDELDELDEPVGITTGVIVGMLGVLHFPLI